MKNEPFILKKLLNGEFVSISELENSNKSKSAATKKSVNEVLLLRKALYGDSNN